MDGADLDVTDNANFVNSLRGKVSGVNSRSSSTMGGSSNIVLRGYSSISGDNQPLDASTGQERPEGAHSPASLGIRYEKSGPRTGTLVVKPTS